MEHGHFRFVAQLPETLCAPEKSAWRDRALNGAGEGSFLEGPCFAPDGALRCVDIPAGRILELSSGGAWRTAYSYDGWPNGMKIRDDGRMIVADHRLGLLEVAADCGSHRILVGAAPDGPFHGLNDLCLGSDGSVYFTDQGASGLEAPFGRVLRFFPDGRLVELMSNIPSPNGIVLTGDETALLVAVTRANAIWRLPLTPRGSVRKAGLFIQLSGGIGPDGLALADEDRLLVVHAGIGVWLFARNGTPLKLWHDRRFEYVTNLAASPVEAGVYRVTESATSSVLELSIDR